MLVWQLGLGQIDIAIEAANYVLMRDNLEDVITPIHLSRKTFSRIRLNYVFAMVYILVALPVAVRVLYPSLGIKLPPWVAGASMALSSVSVVCSSLLLKRYRKPRLTTILEIVVNYGELKQNNFQGCKWLNPTVLRTS